MMVSTRLLSLLAQGSGFYDSVLNPGIPISNIVDLGYAKYQGNLTYSNTVAYLGIPYAEPPLGERRWRKPAPLNTTRVAQEAEGKTVNATMYPAFCIQGSTGGMCSVACTVWSARYMAHRLLQAAMQVVLAAKTVSRSISTHPPRRRRATIVSACVAR